MWTAATIFGMSKIEAMSANEFNSTQLRKFFLTAAVLVLCFGKPLFDLMRLAASSDLYSYIPLIPIISAYLVWSQKKNLPHFSEPAVKPAALFFAGGLAAIASYWLASRSSALAYENYLALTILSFLLFFTSTCCLFLGKEILCAIVFPIGLLVFIIPFPIFFRQWIETFLQHGSAAAASVLFKLSGTPFFQDGLIFQLPGINLEVAPECSGIRSTIALLITSLIAGHLFLRSPWKQATLALAVIPLALLRNGFRVFVIGQLCVHVGPEMINSPIHRHGGPIFFILSLIPFFLLLIFLKKSERVGEKNPS